MEKNRNPIKEADETDRKILNILLENSRLSLRKIARKAGISVATAMKRMQRMEKAGIIKKYSAVVDYEKLGYVVSAMIEVTIEKWKLAETEELLRSEPSIDAVYNVTGPIDTVVCARFPNIEKLNELIQKLNKSPCINRTNTHVIVKRVKEGSLMV